MIFFSILLLRFVFLQFEVYRNYLQTEVEYEVSYLYEPVARFVNAIEAHPKLVEGSEKVQFPSFPGANGHLTHTSVVRNFHILLSHFDGISYLNSLQSQYPGY